MGAIHIATLKIYLWIEKTILKTCDLILSGLSTLSDDATNNTRALKYHQSR